MKGYWKKYYWGPFGIRMRNWRPSTYTFGGDSRNQTPKIMTPSLYPVCPPQPCLIYNPITEAESDVYLGIGAGKHLLNDINKAKHSIKIVSPYLSDSLIHLLYEKMHKEKCHISVITTQGQAEAKDLLGQKCLILHGLRQNVQEDSGAKEHKEKTEKKYSFLCNICCFFVVLFFLILTMLSLQNKFQYFWISAILEIGVMLALIFSLVSLKNNKMTKIRSFTYDLVFPFKILAKNEQIPFLHEKVYIIDDSIAYIGSFNFTNNGCLNNLEVSVKIHNRSSVDNLVQYYDSLMSDSTLPFYGIEEIRKLYFSENYY